MTDLATWIGVLIGIVALVVAYLAYRSQRGKTRLEFVVMVNTKIAIVEDTSGRLGVTYDGEVIPDASVSNIRIVNTGDNAIVAADYSSDLVVRLENVNNIVAATANRARPRDLKPSVVIDGSTVRIKPLLINPGDMIELAMFASGLASSVTIEGRIVNLPKVSQRKTVPYPPGSGPEGEMSGLDKFMWYAFMPVLVVAPFSVAIAFAKASTPAKLIEFFVLAILAGVLYPVQLRYLVYRRRMWRP